MKKCVDLPSMTRRCALAIVLSLAVPCFATVKPQPNAVGGTNPKPGKGTVVRKMSGVAVLIEVWFSLFGL